MSAYFFEGNNNTATDPRPETFSDSKNINIYVHLAKGEEVKWVFQSRDQINFPLMGAN